MAHSQYEKNYDEDPDYFYLTHYYFTLNICRLPRTEAEELEDGTLALNMDEDRVITKKDWHKSFEAARDRAAELIGNKILSLDAQKSRLKARDPETEPLTEITFEETE